MLEVVVEEVVVVERKVRANRLVPFIVGIRIPATLAALRAWNIALNSKR